MTTRSMTLKPKLIPATLIPATLSLALAFVPGCKKDSETQNPDSAVVDDAPADTTPPEAQAALPEQDPDPAEIAALYARYLKGDYEVVVAEAEELRAGLTADTQVRAHALASAIQALAAIEGVPENGQEAAEQALASGERLADPEVLELAHIAHGAYLVRVHEAAKGQVELEAAVALGGPKVALAHLMLAEAHLNQAFGTGDQDMKIVDASKFDDARSSYESALAAGDGLLQASAHEGLAAIAKYKGEKAAVCEHAQQADTLYSAGGATDYIREVPSLLAKDARCTDFKKAE